MPTILHIEDTKANQILVQRVLEAEGYQIVSATDGQTGIRAAEESEPDLILVDMGLPDIDGQTVVTYLKQVAGLNSVPMVAITAWPAEKAFETANRYHFNGCILKPINVRNFPQQIAGYLGTAR